MYHGIFLGDTEYQVALSRAGEGYRLHLKVDDNTAVIPINLVASENGDGVLTINNQRHSIHTAVDGDNIWVHLDGETYQLQFEDALDRLAQSADAAGGDVIKASMPGSVLSLDVAEGDHVTSGQTLLVMESMKMETTIVAPRDGVIAALHTGAGQTFDKDALLVTLEAAEGDEA